ncbi:MAG: phosphotransferase [Acholeplasmataceae bacterium]|nr:phosphotransferase [Acholeplasmataceae bacterium]
MEAHIKALFSEQVLEKSGLFFGVKLEDLFEVGGFENFIYGYKKEGKDYILRISHASHRTYEELLSELDFVNFLANQHANVSIPVLSINQHLVEKVDSMESYFTVSSYIKAEGERPNKKHFDDTFFFNYGKTIGEFHKLTKAYKPDKGIIKRFNWDSDPLFIHARSYLLDTDEIIYQRFKELIAHLNQLPIHQNNYGLIHTDIHMGNFFVKDKNLCVFDFDDSSYMWFVSDIAIALFYYLEFSARDEKDQVGISQFFMTHFMRGYLSENKLTKQDMETMDDFLRLRELVLYIVFYRSVDLSTNQFASNYIKKHRYRIIDKQKFIDIDFTQYID